MILRWREDDNHEDIDIEFLTCWLNPWANSSSPSIRTYPLFAVLLRYTIVPTIIANTAKRILPTTIQAGEDETERNEIEIRDTECNLYIYMDN